jgi:DNA-binding beta-propeller fold protein YncE
LALAFVVALYGAAACAGRTPVRMDLPADSTLNLVWPLPPETPRVEFLRALSTPGDIDAGPSFLGRVAQIFVGRAEENRVRQPYGIAVDSGQRIYVADQASQAIHVFDPMDNGYRLHRGTDRGDFQAPVGVAVGADGLIYVSDSERGVVIAMDADGRETLRIDGPLVRPAGLAVHPSNGLLYVVDVQRHALTAFDSLGTPVREIGGRGTEEGRFNYPTNVTVASDGTVYVTDSMNFRIQAFRPDGTFLRAFGQVGDHQGQLARPKGLGVDSDGHVYVVEGLFDAVNIFDDRGRLLLTFGSPGRGPGQFWLATGLFVDANDRVYVSDSFNGRIQVFQYLAEDG